uniref:Uncharacterized protein n=1 Tax=Parascaris equorum TaxID=6256 RepID=A0A914S4Q9_PAREQ
MPHAIATKESLPQERVPLVIPQDYSYRYREMNLRYRRNDPTKHDVIREVGSNELGFLRKQRHSPYIYKKMTHWYINGQNPELNEYFIEDLRF